MQDALGLGAGKVDTAYSAMDKTISQVNEIKDKLVAATGASDADKAKIQTEITALQAQLKMGADGATYSGSNWLSLNTTDRHRRRRRLRCRQDRFGLHPQLGRRDHRLQTIDITVQSIKLYEAYASATEVQKGIIDGLRLARPAPVPITATARRSPALRRPRPTAIASRR